MKVYYIAKETNFVERYFSEDTDNSVIIIDEEKSSEVLEPGYEKWQRVGKENKYLLVFNRDLTVKNEVGVNSLFEVERIDGVYRFKNRRFPVNTNRDKPFYLGKNCILVEDSNSGYHTLEHYFGKYMKIETSKGNGSFSTKLIELCKKGYNIVAFLDYDVGGSYLYNVSKGLGKYKNQVVFVESESFEEIVCNSNLFLSHVSADIRNRVENYEIYMGCSKEHRGIYFLDLLKQNFVYVDKNSRIPKTRPLYDKDDIDCLVKGCVSDNRYNCGFRDDTDPCLWYKIIFSNKYESIADWLELLMGV